MNILAFLGSPRKKGNSEILLDAFLRGAEMAGGKSEVIRLCDLDIKPCTGCGGCDKTGKCILKDDMIVLHDKLKKAKRIVLTSPIYFYNITAQAKAFVDRTQTLWSWKNIQQQKGAWLEDPDRLGFFLSVAATKGARVFEGAVLTMKYAYDAMGVQYAGDLLVKNVDLKGEMAKKTKTLKKAETAGKKFMLG